MKNCENSPNTLILFINSDTELSFRAREKTSSPQQNKQTYQRPELSLEGSNKYVFTATIAENNHNISAEDYALKTLFYCLKLCFKIKIEIPIVASVFEGIPLMRFTIQKAKLRIFSLVTEAFLIKFM